MKTIDNRDFTLTETLDRLAVETVDRVGDLGVDGVEVAISSGNGLSVTVRGGACETVEHQRDKSLAITVYDGGRKGTATSSDFSAQALADSIAAAKRIADYAESDPCAGLAEPEFLAGEIPELELDHPWEIDAEAAVVKALECERAALSFDQRIKQSDGCSVNRYRGARAYANSHGFHGVYRGTRHSMSAIMIGDDADGMQSGYWYSAARDPEDLEPPDAIGTTAARRTIAKLGARKIPTTELPVLFEAGVAASLIGHLVSAISGAAQYRRASFLLDALGEAVLAPSLNLHEEPHLPGAVGSAPFDGDGVATAAKPIVEAGRLETYLLSAYAARKLGRTPTGNAGGVHNLVIQHGERGFDAMVAGLDRALIVTDLMGFGVNTVTGDYSRGASGFVVERGEIAQAVEEITIAGNLRDMLMGIVEIGSDIDLRGNIRSGSILIDHMAVAGS